MITTTKTVLYSYKCDVHGAIGSENCPYCDRCEHGANLNQHCTECASDEYCKAPITDEEFVAIERVIKGGATLGLYRHPSQPRNFTLLALLPKFLAEYRVLREQP